MVLAVVQKSSTSAVVRGDPKSAKPQGEKEGNKKWLLPKTTQRC